jgi:uncharacterized protein
MRSLFAVALLAALPLRAQQGPPEVRPMPQITSSGEGQAQIRPDRARISIAVETRAATAAAAANDNAVRQKAVFDRLRTLGIPDAQLGTSGYSLQPQVEYDRTGGGSRVTGYIARNTILAEIRQLDRVGPAIDAAISAGANNINGLDFFASNTDAARRQALGDAVRQARADAEVMATAAGGRLGPLLELSSSSYQPPAPMPRFEMAQTAVAAETPVNPGEQTLTVQVTARWQYLGPPR